MKLHAIKADELLMQPIALWDHDWLLLTSGDFSKGTYNAMTVAWGGFGNMWNLPIAVIVVRPTRYTFEFINTFTDFTLCGFEKEFQTALKILGTKSGRDGDKIAASGLTPQAAEKVKAPVFQQANLHIECRQIYRTDYEPSQFLDKRIIKNYSDNDFHTLIFGEILASRGSEKYLGT